MLEAIKAGKDPRKPRAKHMTTPVSPVWVSGLRDLVRDPNSAKYAFETQLVTADMSILTLEGALPAAHLYEGDMVITSHGALPLLRLRAVHIPQEIRLGHAPCYSLGPDQHHPCDLFPSQMVKQPSCEMVFARDLIGKGKIGYRSVPQARLFALHFAMDVAVYTQGLGLRAAKPVTEPV